MIDYTNYTDRHIRNLEKPSEEEEALANLQADEAVKSFLGKYANEPRFAKRIYRKLADKLVDESTKW